MEKNSNKSYDACHNMPSDKSIGRFLYSCACLIFATPRDGIANYFLSKNQ